MALASHYVFTGYFNKIVLDFSEDFELPRSKTKNNSAFARVLENNCFYCLKSVLFHLVSILEETNVNLYLLAETSTICNR